MKTFTTLTSLFTTLSNNTSSANTTLGGQLISDQHRYTLQKYFDNERVYTTVTIGGEDLTLTGVLASGAISATLTAVWPNITCQQLVTFSNSDQRTVTFTKNSTAISWQTGLTDTATVDITTIGVQSYPIPPQVSKIKNDTITVGQLVYTPAPVMSIQEWTLLNALPYTSDIPNYFYIYNGNVNFWPIPSTSGNLISFNYKGRVPDLSISDYSTGSLTTLAVGSTTITGSGTTWTGIAPAGVDITFLNIFMQITPPKGEGIWYQVQKIVTDTSLTLIQPLQNVPSTTTAASGYTIGQLPLLSEDFHDMLVYGALMVYFTSIVKDETKNKMYAGLYEQRLNLLEAYAGSKSVNVDLGMQPVLNNPNLFYMGT